jgi:hypothetical protein
LSPHSPPVQALPGAHWAAVVQVVKQAEAPLHTNGAHEMVGGDLQLPAPSHFASPLSTLAVASQEAGRQMVSAPRSRQAPAPSQVPSWPHEPAVATAQPGWPAGEVPPAGTFMHDPGLPETSQDWHRSVQAVAQQTPSAQIPEAQSVPAPHASPR